MFYKEKDYGYTIMILFFLGYKTHRVIVVVVVVGGGVVVVVVVIIGMSVALLFKYPTK